MIGFSKNISRAQILDIPVPKDTNTYKAISVRSIFNTIDSLTTVKRFNIVQEHLEIAQKGQQQKMRFGFATDDSKFHFEIAVLNSYNKTLALKAAGGVSVAVCFNGMILGDVKIQEKHMGTIQTDLDEFFIDLFDTQEILLKEAQIKWQRYNSILLNKADVHNLIGELYLEQELVNSEQLSIIKKELTSPSIYTDVTPKSLNHLYQAVTYAQRGTHPTLYTDNRIQTQDFFDSYLALAA
jgi:hypothetical protein